jgi:uncharacterized membrane protein YczE
MGRRLVRLLFGLLLFGLGIAIMVMSGLGLPPWEVLHQGISEQTGIPIGTVGIITGLFVLLLWIPLRERIGLGTVLNVILIGLVIDATLYLIDYGGEPLWFRTLMMLTGVLLIGIGTAFYIGAGLGPGPRDGLMTGLARRGYPIGRVRIGLEVTVLIIGWLLGGTVGVGTVVFAFGVGPMIAWYLPRLTFEPETAPAPPPTRSEAP